MTCRHPLHGEVLLDPLPSGGRKTRDPKKKSTKFIVRRRKKKRR